MSSFTDSATTFLAAQASASQRQAAWDAFSTSGLPTTSDEVWRYAPLGDLSLERYHVAPAPTDLSAGAFASDLASQAALVITVVDGFLVSTSTTLAGVSVDLVDDLSGLENESLLTRYEADSFAMLNAALTPGSVRVRVENGVNVDGTIVILHLAGAQASFSRVQLELGRSASANVIEYFEGGADALVVPLSEYRLDDNASLQLVTYQRLATSAWHVARSTGFVHRDARLRQSVIGLGAHYNRSRNDATFLGSGAHNELRTTFLGAGDQVHDFRTRQFHVVGRTNSVLLSKGAVADRARSVYTGLIEIEKGAKRTDARQTNHNLLLSPHAHADSVPNLDIRENDVVCAHASSVGPLDELQRWYLESRGVPRDVAERLMIQGFFNEMLVTLPAGIAELVEADVTALLAQVDVVAP
jgi:Fe-S cluster assembly protein SufD